MDNSIGNYTNNNGDNTEKSMADVALSVIQDDIWGSFKASATAPVRALVEIGNRDAAAAMKIEPPQAADFGTGRFWAQQVGNAAGMLPWFVASHKAVGKLSSLAGAEMATMDVTSKLGRATATGALFGGLLTPADAPSDFTGRDVASMRITSAARTAVAFTLMDGAGMALGRGLRPASLVDKIAVSAMSGAIGGVAEAQIHALKERRWATEKEFAQAATKYALLGGGMTAINALPGFKESKVAVEESPMGGQSRSTAISDMSPGGGRSIVHGHAVEAARLNATGGSPASDMSPGGGRSIVHAHAVEAARLNATGGSPASDMSPGGGRSIVHGHAVEAARLNATGGSPASDMSPGGGRSIVHGHAVEAARLNATGGSPASDMSPGGGRSIVHGHAVEAASRNATGDLSTPSRGPLTAGDVMATQALLGAGHSPTPRMLDVARQLDTGSGTPITAADANAIARTTGIINDLSLTPYAAPAVKALLETGITPSAASVELALRLTARGGFSPEVCRLQLQVMEQVPGVSSPQRAQSLVAEAVIAAAAESGMNINGKPVQVLMKQLNGKLGAGNADSFVKSKILGMPEA